MKQNKKFFQIDVDTESKVADIHIYGQITSWPWIKSDVSAFSFIQQIEGLDVDKINVYINSPGGEVGEAVAIYSALKRHSAEVNTFCDGFACSAASIIFCAGDNRIMGNIAMLMIHNCMSYVGYANADELRKAATDTEKINQCSIEAYKAVSNLSEDKIKELMDAETWITAEEAKEYGFATDIAETVEDEENGVTQSAQSSIQQAILSVRDTQTTALLTVLTEVRDAVQKITVPKQQETPADEGKGKQTNELKNSFKNFFNNIK